MTQILGSDFEYQVADAVREMGYKATTEPSRMPNLKFWPNGLMSWVRGPKYRPDIIVEDGNQLVIIETKARTVLLGSVIRARELGDYFGAPVILCVPDDSFSKIPGSVRDFADRANVRLCPLSQVGDALKELLGKPTPPHIRRRLPTNDPS